MNTSDNQNEDSKAKTAAAESQTQRRIVLLENRIDSRDLFGSVREITINHGSEIYRLRMTAQNKLILTK